MTPASAAPQSFSDGGQGLLWPGALPEFPEDDDDDGPPLESPLLWPGAFPELPGVAGLGVAELGAEVPGEPGVSWLWPGALPEFPRATGVGPVTGAAAGMVVPEAWGLPVGSAVVCGLPVGSPAVWGLSIGRVALFEFPDPAGGLATLPPLVDPEPAEP